MDPSAQAAALHRGATAESMRRKNREGEAVLKVEGIEGMLTKAMKLTATTGKMTRL